MTNTHTPGPWKWVERSYDHSFALVGSNDETVADDGSAWGEYGQVINPHGYNARLIAAAPELLAALKTAEDALRGASASHGIDFYACAEEAAAAIAKAEKPND